jgi:ABC-type phosphate/phosphonate transport system substrate-binding protein
MSYPAANPATTFSVTRTSTQTVSRTTNTLLCLLIGLLIQTTAFADIVLTAPPRESAEAGAKLYEPLAKSLSQLLGEKVVYQHPGDWHNYQRQLQNDQYDIVFDGPHFAAWRMTSLKATPLVRLPGNLRFVLVTGSADNKVTRVNDLIGKKVCTLPSPNLGALTLYSMYPNPVIQPDFVPVKGGFKQVTKKLLAGECRGAIMRSSFYYKKLPTKTRDKFKVLQESRPIINQGITVSHRVNWTARKKMLQALTTQSGNNAIRPILDRFAHKANAFVPARQAEYVGKNLLHDNMVYGW